jgi:hypothetical protein
VCLGETECIAYFDKFIAGVLTLSWPAGNISPNNKESFYFRWDNSIPLFLHAAIYLEVYLFRWTSQNAFSRKTHVYKWYCVQCCYATLHTVSFVHTLSMASCADWLDYRIRNFWTEAAVDCVISVTEWSVSNVATRILIGTRKFRTANETPPLRIFISRNPWNPLADLWCSAEPSLRNTYMSNAVLHRVREQRNILRIIKRRKANWICQILCRNCSLKHVRKKSRRKDRFDRKTKKQT